MKPPSARLDGPWKAALERWLAEFLALFVPHVLRDIDWSRGFTFLDTELAQDRPGRGGGWRHRRQAGPRDPD